CARDYYGSSSSFDYW
nr:immunoglobulin heavy chain junction region [Mus musculus]